MDLKPEQYVQIIGTQTVEILLLKGKVAALENQLANLTSLLGKCEMPTNRMAEVLANGESSG